jgi:hypothetical protein
MVIGIMSLSGAREIVRLLEAAVSCSALADQSKGGHSTEPTRWRDPVPDRGALERPLV